MHLDKMVKEED